MGPLIPAPWPLARAVMDRALTLYAGLLFSRSRGVGALLLLATAFEPTAFVGGTLSVVVALFAARALGLSGGEAWDGSIGCSALLVGLGLSHSFSMTPSTWALVALAAAATTLVSAALATLLARVALPPLTSAFLVVFPLAVATAMHGGWTLRAGSAPLDFPIPSFLAASLDSLGALLFLPRWDAGLCVLAALLVHSRIATLQVVMALSLVGALLESTATPFDPSSMLSVRLNAWLATMALGGVWFVPSASSLFLGLAGGLLAALLSLGLSSASARVGIPLLIAPFYAASALVLLATRQRVQDQSPKSVDFLPGTPEENLRHHQTRRARFSSRYPVAFHLPFRGEWTCTQAVDGPHTHQGPWRFAFDFEVRGSDGAFASRGGLTVEDHHCYRLPVLAAADGVVVSTESDRPDVPIGEVDVEHNWGNRVLVSHGVGLYSLVAHLAPGSVRVRPGQVVRRGEVLGLCGSSGRSPRPHLHFQLQSSPELGAPTLPCTFVDAVQRVGDEERLAREFVPGEGDVVRPIEPDEALEKLVAWPLGVVRWFELDSLRERVDSTVSLLGQPTLVSSLGPSLPFAATREGFTAYDPLGEGTSVLHLLRLALPRLPFDARGRWEFSDRVPRRLGLGGGLGVRPMLDWLFDFAAPFRDDSSWDVTYSVHREPGRVVVTGRSQSGSGGKLPAMTTRVVLDGLGISSLEVKCGARMRRATRTTGPGIAPRRVPLDERSSQTWIGGRA